MGVKHGVVISDKHCGHLVGLTPPEYQLKPKYGGVTKRNKWWHIQKDLWQEFDNIFKSLPKLDFIFSLGDHIDGKGERSGGVEQLTLDMQEQCDMSVAVFEHMRKYCKPTVKIVSVYGTPYHTTTNGDEWENIIAHRAGFDKIGSHEWIDVNGCIFDLKHHIGSSSVPHGRHTQSAKQHLWNLLWAEKGLQPKANVILRGHVHYHQYCGGTDWVAITSPALQGTDGSFDWQAFTNIIKSQKAEALVI